MRLLLFAAAACFFAPSASAQILGEHQQPTPLPPNLSPPRVLRYDFEQDEIYHYHSVVAPEPTRQPGGAISYYGNRLTQLRYFGPPTTGGIYDAVDDFADERSLEGAKYKYRWSPHRP